MGIKNLYSFLKKRNIIIQIPCASLAGKTLAIDISCYLYKFICIEARAQGMWIDMFIDFCIYLLNLKVKPVFVFDGSAPEEKSETKKQRRKIRDEYHIKATEIKNKMQKEGNKSELLQQYLKYNSASVNITLQDNAIARDLLSLMGIPWLNAVGEAEKSCSWLCKKGYVDGVITSDSDVIAYGCPVLIRDFRKGSQECSIIFIERLLNELSLDYPQLLDFCIMCGTDYNTNITRIGPEKAYNLIIEYESIDKLPMDTAVLKYSKVRELFNIETDDVREILANPKENIVGYLQSIDGSVDQFLCAMGSIYTCELIKSLLKKPMFKIRDTGDTGGIPRKPPYTTGDTPRKPLTPRDIPGKPPYTTGDIPRKPPLHHGISPVSPITPYPCNI